jgi:hypothetical protein
MKKYIREKRFHGYSFSPATAARLYSMYCTIMTVTMTNDDVHVHDDEKLRKNAVLRCVSHGIRSPKKTRFPKRKYEKYAPAPHHIIHTQVPR